MVIEPQNANLPPLLEEPGSRQENLEFPEAKGYTLRPLANFKTIGSSSMLKWLVRLFIVMMLGAVLGVASLIGIYFYIKPQLPDVTALRDVKLATPMKVYSRDGELISQFGEIRRIPLHLDEIPSP